MSEVYRRIDACDWPGLLAHDQLLAEKGKGNAFKYFKEGTIDFPPTYKYQPGTNLYERREDKKKRTPVSREARTKHTKRSLHRTCLLVFEFDAPSHLTLVSVGVVLFRPGVIASNGSVMMSFNCVIVAVRR